MKSKTIILIVRRHAGEVDWLLPLLFKFNKKFRIITIFSDQSSFDSLKNNIDIFNLWSQICSEYFIVKKENQFIWKFLHLILRKLNFSFLNKKEKLVLNKTFDIKSFLNKFNTNIHQIKCVFVTHSHATYLPHIFKNQNSKIQIIRFPEATMISASLKENPKLKNYNKVQNTYGDLFLFSSISNKELFLGKKNKNEYIKDVYYCGLLRYEKWWINKFIQRTNKSFKKFKILVAIRGPHDDYFQLDSYNNCIDSIMKVAQEINNCEVIFKSHPNEFDFNILKKKLSVFKNIKWSIEDSHIMKLSSKSNLCISVITSACFDAIALKVPTIEFYNVEHEIKHSNKVKTLMHMAFDKRDKKWKSIFSYKKIIQNVYDYETLKKRVLSVYNNKNKVLWNKNYHTFQKLVNFRNNSNKLYKLINKKIS